MFKVQSSNLKVQSNPLTTPLPLGEGSGERPPLERLLCILYYAIHPIHSRRYHGRRTGLSHHRLLCGMPQRLPGLSQPTDMGHPQRTVDASGGHHASDRGRSLCQRHVLGRRPHVSGRRVCRISTRHKDTNQQKHLVLHGLYLRSAHQESATTPTARVDRCVS